MELRCKPHLSFSTDSRLTVTVTKSTMRTEGVYMQIAWHAPNVLSSFLPSFLQEVWGWDPRDLRAREVG